jgi:hypothetical protein
MMLAEIERRQRERHPRAFGETKMSDEQAKADGAPRKKRETVERPRDPNGEKTVGAKVSADMRNRLAALKKSRGMKSIAEALVYAAAKGLDGMGA